MSVCVCVCVLVCVCVCVCFKRHRVLSNNNDTHVVKVAQAESSELKAYWWVHDFHCSLGLQIVGKL